MRVTTFAPAFSLPDECFRLMDGDTKIVLVFCSSIP